MLSDFSMYEFASDALRRAGAEDLGDVSLVSRREFVERQSFLFRATVPCLEYVSLLIENAVLLRSNRAGRVYAGFEKLSRMEPVADRYLRIADLSERVYVFGESDWKPPRHPHLKIIHTPPGAKLSREWVVIADSPSMRVALVAQDEEGFDAPSLDARRFRAAKTSDPNIVSRLAARAEDLVDSLLTV